MSDDEVQRLAQKRRAEAFAARARLRGDIGAFEEEIFELHKEGKLPEEIGTDLELSFRQVVVALRRMGICPDGSSQKEQEYKRFLSKVRKDPENGCWIWVGVLSKGHPVFSYTGGRTVARKWVYAYTYGPIALRHIVRNTCQNTFCVNPDHLEVVQKRPAKRPHARKKIRQICEDHGLSERDVLVIYGECMQGRLTYSQIAEGWNIPLSIVGKIATGKGGV